ncbi:unnamed protein product [Calicophoron daubneyi]|uniref:Methyltransferase domain-containing protein n=1 Tax=Calicophoron daubneyi TaxID=300641 RepID=A0AAV2TYX3_CALDB
MNDDLVLNSLLRRSLYLMEQFRPFLEAYVTNYYAEGGWRHIPHGWITQPALDLDDLNYLLSGFCPRDVQFCRTLPKRPLPLGLLAYRVACLSVQLNVDALSRVSPAMEWQRYNVLFASHPELKNNLLEFLRLDSEENDASKFSCTGEDEVFHGLPAQFRRHISPKKGYEIRRHSSLLLGIMSAAKKSSNLLRSENIVVDVGSGQGHLARYLSLYLGLRVLSLEAEEAHLQKAYKFDSETKAYLKKKWEQQPEPRMNFCSGSPSSHLMRIRADTSTSDVGELVKRMEDTWQQNGSSHGDMSKARIFFNGLHTCGDLSMAILRLFMELESAVGVVTVGCCYMKAVVDASTTAQNCQKSLSPSHLFWCPLSVCLQSVGLCLSYSLLELACHSISDYLSRLRHALTSGVDHLRPHGYRAFAQLLFTRRVQSFAEKIDSKCKTELPSFRSIRCGMKRRIPMDFAT